MHSVESCLTSPGAAALDAALAAGDADDGDGAGGGGGVLVVVRGPPGASSAVAAAVRASRPSAHVLVAAPAPSAAALARLLRPLEADSSALVVLLADDAALEAEARSEGDAFAVRAGGDDAPPWGEEEGTDWRRRARARVAAYWHRLAARPPETDDASGESAGAGAGASLVRSLNPDALMGRVRDVVELTLPSADEAGGPPRWRERTAASGPCGGRAPAARGAARADAGAAGGGTLALLAVSSAALCACLACCLIGAGDGSGRAAGTSGGEARAQVAPARAADDTDQVGSTAHAAVDDAERRAPAATGDEAPRAARGTSARPAASSGSARRTRPAERPAERRSAGGGGGGRGARAVGS